jgi:ribose-phosphate pyrophosphokinase
MENVIIVGCVADNPFVEDMAQFLCQKEDYSDLISLKSFLNTEFCPRFIVNEEDWDNIGNKLKGKTVLIVSSSMGRFTRNDLAMRNFLIGRAAKDNGADRVVLLESDLYYSAQDRGPRKEHDIGIQDRSLEDYKKFDGQPFSARLYADLLEESGIDEIVTVHNHSNSVKAVFMDRLAGFYHNLEPFDVYAHYMRESDIVDYDNLVLCAPDEGAVTFVRKVREALGKGDFPILIMDKERTTEREVEVTVSPRSEIPLKEIEGKHVAVVDDMVRTGKTVVEACRLLKDHSPAKITFFVTHFYSSQEGRINMNDPAIDEIVTTNTIPRILNRDSQGRLRHKMVVLRLEKWIANYIFSLMAPNSPGLSGSLYREDMSSKNPRWRGKMGPLFCDV